MRISLLLLFILLLTTATYAQYNADITLDIQSDGLVEITGESNHPDLQEGIYDDYVSKRDGYWLLNISILERFDQYSYEILLPPKSTINYVGVLAVDTLEEEGRFHITGEVTDKPFILIMQYKTKPVTSNIPILSITILLVLIAVIMTIWYFRKDKKDKKSFNKEEFSEREYSILKILQKNKGTTTQAKIENITNLPKASLHRAIKSLERKELITIHKTGIVIRLN